MLSRAERARSGVEHGSVVTSEAATRACASPLQARHSQNTGVVRSKALVLPRAVTVSLTPLTSMAATSRPAATDPFALAADGTARDPVAFQAAIRSDPESMAAVQADPELAATLLGDDLAAMQALLHAAFEVRRWCLCCPCRPCGAAHLQQPPQQHGPGRSPAIRYACR